MLEKRVAAAVQYFFVYMTAPDKSTATRIAQTLVHERLAACANILDGASSIYWWESRVEESQEAVCILKTTEKRYPALEARAHELHPYDTPCIVALPLASGFSPFLQWLEEETGNA